MKSPRKVVHNRCFTIAYFEGEAWFVPCFSAIISSFLTKLVSVCFCILCIFSKVFYRSSMLYHSRLCREMLVDHHSLLSDGLVSLYLFRLQTSLEPLPFILLSFHRRGRFSLPNTLLLRVLKQGGKPLLPSFMALSYFSC